MLKPHQPTSHRLLCSLAFLSALMGLNVGALALDGTTQKEVIVQSTVALEQLVRQAHQGDISPERLRTERVRVERKLDAHLAKSAVAARPKEQLVVNQARTDFNVARSLNFLAPRIDPNGVGIQVVKFKARDPW
jgi:hypothetical protein